MEIIDQVNNIFHPTNGEFTSFLEGEMDIKLLKLGERLHDSGPGKAIFIKHVKCMMGPRYLIGILPIFLMFSRDLTKSEGMMKKGDIEMLYKKLKKEEILRFNKRLYVHDDYVNIYNKLERRRDNFVKYMKSYDS